MDFRFVDLQRSLLRDAMRPQQPRRHFDLGRTRVHVPRRSARSSSAVVRCARAGPDILRGAQPAIGRATADQTGMDRRGTRTADHPSLRREGRGGAGCALLSALAEMSGESPHLARRFAGRRRSCRAAPSASTSRSRPTRGQPRPRARQALVVRRGSQLIAEPDRDRREAPRCACATRRPHEDQ